MKTPASSTLSHRREAAHTWNSGFGIFLWSNQGLRGESEGVIVDQGHDTVTGSGLQLVDMDSRCAESTPGTVPCSVSKITMFVQQSPLARGAKEGLKTFMPGTSLRPSARRRAFAWSCSITCAARGFTFQGKAGMMRRVGYGEECAKK
jgi:hypothetical protein